MNKPKSGFVVGYDESGEDIQVLAIGFVDDKDMIKYVKHFYGQEAKENYDLLMATKDKKERKKIMEELVKGDTNE